MNKKILFLILFAVLISFIFVYAQAPTTPPTPTSTLTAKSCNTQSATSVDSDKNTYYEKNQPKTPTTATAPPKILTEDISGVKKNNDGTYSGKYNGDDVTITKDSSGGYTAKYVSGDNKGEIAYYTKDTKTSSGQTVNTKCKGGTKDCIFSLVTTDKTGKRTYDNIPEMPSNLEQNSRNKNEFTNNKGDTVTILSKDGTINFKKDDGKTEGKSTSDGFLITKYDECGDDLCLKSKTTHYKDGRTGYWNLNDEGNLNFISKRESDGRNDAYWVSGKDSKDSGNYWRVNEEGKRSDDGKYFCKEGNDCINVNNRKTIDELASTLDKDAADKLKKEERSNNFWTGNSDWAVPGKILSDASGIYGNISGNRYWLDKWGWGVSKWEQEVGDLFARSVFSEERFLGTTWCSEWFDDEDAPVTVIPGAGGNPAGHIEGRRADAYYEENGEPKHTYIYTITLSVDPKSLMEKADDYLEFKVFVDPSNPRKYLKIDGENELIKIKSDSEPYRKDGSDAIQQVVEKSYDKVCIEFISFDRFTAEVRSLMDQDNVICNSFIIDTPKDTTEDVLFGIGVPEGGETEGGGGGDSASATEQESRPDTVNPQGVQSDFS